MTPRADAPARLAPGEPLLLTVATASGLTPPPGLQEPRAHRGWAVSLCSEGLSVGAPARVCTALVVDDVRPCASHDVQYRVRVRVEPWLAPGAYTLRVRFPGGEAELPAGVRIGATHGARAHVGALGLQALPKGAEIAPLPAPEGGFAPGFVLQTPALGVLAPALQSASPVAPRIRPELAMEAQATRAMGRIHVRVLGAPTGARVFVRTEHGESASGPDVWLPAGVLGPLAISALVVLPDGRTSLLTTAAEVAPRLAFGCSLPAGGGGRPSGAAGLGLLVLALSVTLLRFVRRRPSRPPAQSLPSGGE